MNIEEDLQELSEIQETINTFFLAQYVVYSLLSLIIANIILFRISPSFLDKIQNLFIAEIICSFICFGFSYVSFPIIKKIFSKNKCLFLKRYIEIRKSIESGQIDLESVKEVYKLK